MANKYQYFLLTITLLLLLAGQVLAKMGALGSSVFNIFVLAAYLTLLLRGILWVFVLEKLPLTFAYPLMSLSFVLILPASALLFDEAVSFPKIFGSLLIIAGLAFTARGHAEGAKR